MERDIIMIAEPNPEEWDKVLIACKEQDCHAFITENFSYADSSLKMTNFFSAVVIEVFIPMINKIPYTHSNDPLGLALIKKCLELKIPCLLVYEDKFTKNLNDIKKIISIAEQDKKCKQTNTPLISKSEGWKKIISEVIKLIEVK